MTVKSVEFLDGLTILARLWLGVVVFLAGGSIGAHPAPFEMRGLGSE